MLQTRGLRIALDLTGPGWSVGEHGNGQNLLALPHAAVALGADYVLLDPPRGSHNTSLYNEFLRIEETIAEAEGSSFL
jgi:enolase